MIFAPAGVVRRKLRQLLKAALGSAPRKQVLLDLYAGCGRVGASWQTLSGRGRVSLDVQADADLDLRNPVVVNFLRGWIAARVVRAVFMGPPCTTWSRASGGYYRSACHIYGQPSLSGRALAKATDGNLHVRSCALLVQACLDHGVPIGLENPRWSMMWDEPVLSHLLQHPRCRNACTYFCQHGARWKKPTRVAMWNSRPPVSQLTRTCAARGNCCSRTHLPHIQLKGSGPGGKAWTSIAEPYPPSFARLIANWLHASANATEHAHACKLLF